MKISIFFTSTFVLAVVGEKLAEQSDDIEGKVDKKYVKRGIFSLGHGYGTYGTLGGYGYGSSLTPSHYHYHGLHQYGYPASIHTTITKHVPVAVPHLVPVPVEKHVPVAVPVEVPRPYPVEVVKFVPVAVHRPVPVAHPVAVPYPVPSSVYRPVGGPVATYPFAKPIAFPFVHKEIYEQDW